MLEATQENITALLMGLEYLTNISYVDDTEVFKVCVSLSLSLSRTCSLNLQGYDIVSTISYDCTGLLGLLEFLGFGTV